MAVSWKVLLEWLWYGGRRHLQCGWEYAISTACAQSTDTRKKCSASLNLHSRRCRVVHEGFEFLLCVLDLRNRARTFREVRNPRIFRKIRISRTSRWIPESFRRRTLGRRCATRLHVDFACGRSWGHIKSRQGSV
jgi:hypothetical protein